MADTVKKSRIVSEPGECLAAASFSDDDASLQDIINEEFNQRLKSCMRDETYLEPNEEHIALTYEPGEVVLKNGDLKTQIIHQHQKQQEQELPQQHQESEPSQHEQEPTLDFNLASTTDLETTVLKTSEVLNKESPKKESSVNGSIIKSISQEGKETVTETLEEGLTSPLIKENTSINNEHSTNGLNHSTNHSNHEETHEPFQTIDQEPSPEDSFVNKEVPSPEDDIESPFDNVTVTDVDNENLTAKERFLSTVKDIEDEDDASKLATIKDRMFLSTDSACLLFTQTVVQSPMLTPTDENYDFLQGLRQNSSDTIITSLEQVSPVKNEEIVAILEDISAKTTEESIDEDQINKPDNLELVEAEATDDVSEISAENEVCNKLESSNSEELSESLKNEDLQDETHENQENIKDITLKFITNEISEIDGDLSASKCIISSDKLVYKQTPTIVEHLVEDIDPDNDEIIEDYSLPPSEDKQDVSTEIIEDTSSDIPETIPYSEEITEDESSTKTEETKSSPSKVSEISKIFTPKESEELKEEIKSPVLDETFEDVKKISKIFSPKESEDKEEIKSPVLEETFEDIKKISKMFSPKGSEDDSREEIKSPILEETFEDIKKISKMFSPKGSEDDFKEEIKSPVLDETFEDIKKISKIFSPKDSEDESKEEIKSPVLEETFEDIKKISKIFSSKDEDLVKEEPKSPVLDETFEDIKKTKEIFERISTGSEDISTVMKSSELVKRLSDPSSPGSDASECSTNLVCRNSVSSTVTSESSFVETRTETNSNQDKVLKKKKSKKSKKDNEKENISVCDYTNTNDEDNLSHVSVKNLCRSFSDLTSIGSKNADTKLKTRIAYGRTKSMSDIRRDDVSLENVFTHVSVKSLKSSFSKFDALQKKTVLHVRSSDSGKAQEKFNGTTQIDTSSCKACGKQVFQMEQMKAEKSIWHKNCFRCQECNKQLNVDTYQSNEGVLYCKPHFKALFTPKAVEDEPQPMRPRKHEMIIRENQPEELPPDVVRASDKPDLGLEELQNLNVKERFQVFEHHDNQENNLERTPSSVNVKRSPSILSKLAKFQSKGMDIGVADDSLNGVPVEESSSEEEEEEEEIEGEDAELVRARRAQREKPMHFSNMSDVMSKWESGNQMTKEERREERKQEIQSIRSRLFMGKQAKIKEMYQQAVLDSSSGVHVRKQVPLDAELSESARSVRERFERGEQLTSAEQQTLTELDDAAVFETGISKKSRSIFLELDANASKPPSLKVVSPGKGEVRRAREAFVARQASEDVVRASDQLDAVEVKTADISSRFKFFETYKEPEKQRKQFRITPPRDGQPQPDSVDTSPAQVAAEPDDTQEATAAHTATRMLSVFRQMEESAGKDQTPAGPKPLKRFTPPPEPQRTESESDEEYSDEEEDGEEEDDEERRVVDEDLIEAQKAARAKHLRAKFEKWEANEIKREQNNSSVNIAEEIADADSQIESAKSLRARFESMRETPSDKERTPRVKVNRFVDTTNNVEMCKSCEGRVYPLEKVSCHNNVYHKNCFRCRECNTILRMDSYTYNQGLLYCLPHFKRLFIAKGNYEAGFGLDQHKEKWNTVA